MYKLETTLKRYVNSLGLEVLDKGTLSVITNDPDNSNRVIKHTVCSASSKFIEEPKNTKGLITLVEGDLLYRKYLTTRDGEAMACSFSLPKLNKLLVKDLGTEQLKAYREYQSYIKSIKYACIGMGSHASIIGTYLHKLDSTKLPNGLKRDLSTLIHSLEHGEFIDGKLSGNIMKDDLGNLVITDPVFNRVTFKELFLGNYE